ncbi:hypothetical protein FDECE_4194 [Fusarium decemcellulare]|nr:hypothetical protein FDECE_4194 [Fusarium decemcellulare]
MTETAVESPAEAIAVPSAEPVVADASPVAEAVNTNGHTVGSSKPTTTSNTTSTSSPLTRLALTPSALDAFVLHLHRCIRTRGGTDTVLLFTTYSARLVGAILDVLGRTTLRHSARKLVELAFQLPPSSTVVLSTASAPPLAALALDLSKRIKGFTDMMGEWRTMNRMWGIVATYLAARDLLHRIRGQKQNENGEKVPPPDRLNTLIETIQVLLLVGYHFGEATWLLTSKGATNVSAKTSNKLAIYGARSWSTWVFLELFRLLVERARRTPTDDVAVEEEWKTNWKADFVGTLPWAPLSVHWGTEGGMLPELAVAALATWPATNMIKNLWRQTA